MSGYGDRGMPPLLGQTEPPSSSRRVYRTRLGALFVAMFRTSSNLEVLRDFSKSLGPRFLVNSACRLRSFGHHWLRCVDVAAFRLRRCHRNPVLWHWRGPVRCAEGSHFAQNGQHSRRGERITMITTMARAVRNSGTLSIGAHKH